MSMTMAELDKLSTMSRHLCASLHALDDLSRMLEAVRYSAGLGKKQVERLEKARKVSASAEAFLDSITPEDAA